MNVLQELREHIKAASGVESPSPNHKSIATYIAANIVNNPNSLFKGRVPPLDIILYAIRRLLTPTDPYRLQNVPDLLDLATTVEFWRKLALNRVDEALAIDEYYRGNRPSEHQTLTEEELETLRTFKADGPSERAVYVETVLQFCQFDIYQLWTSDPPCAADVTLRMCEYFPELNDIYRAARADSPCLFHKDLTGVEREALHVRGIDCCSFVSNSCAWASANRLPGQTLAEVFQTPEFLKRFPCAVLPARLRESMDYYLSTVEQMVVELQEILPES
ncbi:hypothetical protein R3P38DRAFT_2859246 [Favolaschia claudopus]|uniref:Uncharacterized protein n=1 Tax=Favolaschia claudopus TaxID=2862362 RepID=A0AAW0DMH7_9AGAR